MSNPMLEDDDDFGLPSLEGEIGVEDSVIALPDLSISDFSSSEKVEDSYSLPEIEDFSLPDLSELEESVLDSGADRWVESMKRKVIEDKIDDKKLEKIVEDGKAKVSLDPFNDGHSIGKNTVEEFSAHDEIVDEDLVYRAPSLVGEIVEVDGAGGEEEEGGEEVIDDFAALLEEVEEHPGDSFLLEDSSELSEDDEYFAYFGGDDEEEEDILAGFDLDAVISQAIVDGASDIYIVPDDQVCFKILGGNRRYENFLIPTGTTTLRLQQDIISNVLETDFIENLELDTSYVVKKGDYAGRRLRLSMGLTMGGIFMCFRVIADVIPDPEKLGVSPILREWTQLPKGLIMVNGPTGVGKSTTLAALLRQAQMTRDQTIITLERPVEFIYGNDGPALVIQREIGQDARSFSGALTSAMRQNPDIILVGEVRNKVEVNELLRAAESGHLAISTMHTNSSAATINRIKSLFEGDEQRRVLSTISDVAKGFANQVLLKAPDGKSRFAVWEILEITEEVGRLIFDGDVKGIRDYQWDRKITMEHELARAALAGRCTVEEARKQAELTSKFDEILKHNLV